MGKQVKVQITGICKHSMMGSIVLDQPELLSRSLLMKLGVYAILILILSVIVIKAYNY
jgi:hypothetical protein